MSIEFNGFARELTGVLQNMNRLQQRIHKALELSLKGAEIAQAGQETIIVKGEIGKICGELQDDGQDVWNEMDTITASFCGLYDKEHQAWVEVNVPNVWSSKLNAFVPREKLKELEEQAKPTQGKE